MLKKAPNTEDKILTSEESFLRDEFERLKAEIKESKSVKTELEQNKNASFEEVLILVYARINYIGLIEEQMEINERLSAIYLKRLEELSK